MQSLTVSEVARDIERRSGQTVPPKVISDLFYKRQLSDAQCPIHGRVRLIPEEYVAEIERILCDRGVISRDTNDVPNESLTEANSASKVDAVRSKEVADSHE